ncbi:hypothetical protein DWG24_19875 [Dickeya zeae]|uniref:Uncharacterized protein n=1 Tax=Dickeya zeae TaxID=204042 RepID=A0AAE7D0V7_9GAMM|nr:hypothetical protein DWG24_19875 [Dickeya zeae]
MANLPRKRRFNGGEICVVVKKEALSNFFEISACQAGITPYNAPPLTRQRRNASAVSVRNQAHTA